MSVFLFSRISGNIYSSSLACSQIINFNYNQSFGAILTPDGFGWAISTAVMRLHDKQRMYIKSKSRQGRFVMIASRYVEHASTLRRNNMQNEPKRRYGLRMYTYNAYIHSRIHIFFYVSSLIIRSISVCCVRARNANVPAAT